jgi:hypothetical protein
MATYKEIRGTQIEAVATDPSNPVEGQVWYNTTSNVLKGQVKYLLLEVGLRNANLNTARASTAAGGDATAAVTAGGNNPGKIANVEYYNGTNWTEVNDLNTAKNSN